MNASRRQLQDLQQDVALRFWRDEPIEELMQALSDGIDTIITDLFNKHFSDRHQVALFAVGGYGRSEVQPGSDIDLLVLAAKPQKIQSEIEDFVRAVFDLNVEVGHSVRDVKSCRSEARADITVATALFERRLITGDNKLAAELDKVMSHPRLWPADKFFRAKYDEQLQRHKDYDNVEYNLEPNIKTSPGGLRDIHTAMWICQRKFGTTDLSRLVELDVISAAEKGSLEEGRRFLWWVRFGLHLLAERKEDRLQFGFQRELAQRLGFVDTDAQMGVERFMHHYYRHVLALTEVNDILIQYFVEAEVPARKIKIEPINERFQITNNYIEVCDENVFVANNAALMEIFVIMANRKDIAGVRADTIRTIRNHLHIIDDEFRSNPEHTRLFMALLKAPYTLVSTLTRMRRYGVLGRYIPEFGRIIGQMQHDMFHIYTVDAHTMRVIYNMRRFRYRSSVENYPVAYHCVQTVPKIELLYLAGLFHDIGKGRGGDHSELGAVDAEKFCALHDLNEADTELVCWLVRKHLYMSSVAQREDIYDPDVVHQFASEMKSEMRLDYLYALTVADINATNPTLWNSWRATLLRHLYNEARKTLRRGLESVSDRQATIAAYQERALERLLDLQPDSPVDDITALWGEMGEDYFLRHTPPQIANLTQALLAHDNSQGPFIDIRDTQGDMQGEGATQIYIYCQDQPRLFAGSVLALSQCRLSIMDAMVSTSDSGMCFDSYIVLDADGEPVSKDAKVREEIRARLNTVIKSGSESITLPQRLLPRRLRELPRPTETSIQPTADGNASTLTVLASDRPGLLATIAELFVELDLHVLSAKIATLGEVVEDTFVIQTAAGTCVSSGEATYTLEHTLRQRLDQELGVHHSGQVMS